MMWLKSSGNSSSKHPFTFWNISKLFLFLFLFPFFFSIRNNWSDIVSLGNPFFLATCTERNIKKKKKRLLVERVGFHIREFSQTIVNPKNKMNGKERKKKSHTIVLIESNSTWKGRWWWKILLYLKELIHLVTKNPILIC